MSNADQRLCLAKDEMTKVLIDLVKLETKVGGFSAMPYAQAQDELNKAWDEIVTILQKRVKLRDEEIVRLMNRLAEQSS